LSWGTEIPNPLSTEALKENNEQTRIDLCKQMQEHGFAVLRQPKNTVLQTRKIVEKEFFDKSKQYKARYELPPSNDPLLKGRKRNRGYVPGSDKEYLKIRLVDKEYPDHIKRAFKKNMKSMYEIVWDVLLRLGQGPNGKAYSEDAAKISFKTTGGIDKVQILPEDKDPSRWLSQATLKPIKDFFSE